ncbi:MAG TPA: DNA primase, partial [Bacillota bacterium]
MSSLRDEAVAEVRSRIDIVDVVSDYVALRRSGRNYVGLCPFHREDTPSFTVAPDKQMFYCFGCQTGGDVFTFVMKREGLDFAEALALLARRAGVRLPEAGLTPAERQRRQRQEQLLQVLEEAARAFEQALQRDPDAACAREYVRARGLTPQAVAAFRLGWARPAWDALLAAFRRRGVPVEILAEAGLIVRSRGGSWYDRFRDRLMFPITDAGGRVIAFGGRSLGEQRPKYLNSPETPLFRKREVLYGFSQARAAMRQQGRALVVEGYMDAIAAHQAGFPFAVASLGTALSEEQVRRLAGCAQRIYVAYDADAAGQQATLRGLEHFSRLAPEVEVLIVRLPAGDDPDSFLRKRGADAFATLLEQAQPLLEYVFERACLQHDPERPEGKARIVKAMAPWLGRVPSEVARSEYTRRLAERLAVDEAALRSELERLSAGVASDRLNGRAAPRWQRNSPVTRIGHKSRTGRYTINAVGGSVIQSVQNGPLEGSVRAERELLRILLHRPDQVGRIADRVSADDFTEGVTKAIARVLFRLAAQPSNAAGLSNQDHRRDWGARVHDELADPEAKALVARWLFEGAPPGRVETIMADCIGRLERARSERRVRQLWQAIAERERSGQKIPGDWLVEYQQLQQA